MRTQWAAKVSRLSGQWLLQSAGKWYDQPASCQEQQKKERKKIKKTVFILQCGDKIAVRKRDKKGLLAGLYEFPNVDQELTAEQAVKQVEDWGCRPRDLQRKAEYKHIFTHVEWEMIGYYFSCDSENEDFQWANQKRNGRGDSSALRIWIFHLTCA